MRKHKKLIILFGCAILLTSLVVLLGILIRSYQGNKPPLDELTVQRESWNRASVGEYQIMVEAVGFTTLSTTICPTAVIHVKDGIIISVEAPETGARWSGFEDYCRNIYGQFTVAGLFDLGEKYILIGNSSILNTVRIQYDDTLGYIKYLDVDASDVNAAKKEWVDEGLIPRTFNIKSSNLIILNQSP